MPVAGWAVTRLALAPEKSPAASTAATVDGIATVPVTSMPSIAPAMLADPVPGWWTPYAPPAIRFRYSAPFEPTSRFVAPSAWMPVEPVSAIGVVPSAATPMWLE